MRCRPYIMLGLLVWLGFSNLVAYGQQTASIPLTEQRLPSDDLFHDNRVLRPDEAYHLRQTGVDLSQLNPVENALWSSNSVLVADELVVQNNDRLVFAGAMLSASGHFRFNARLGDVNTVVHMDKTLHTLLLRKNILRQLGYRIPAMKWLPRLQVTFSSLEEMNSFLDSQVPRATLGAASRWLISKDDNTFTAVLKDVAVSIPQSNEHYNVSMGVPPNSLSSRTLRALLIPYALLDLGESVNKWEWTVGLTRNNQIELPHFTRGNFTTTMDDARWVMNRLGQLSIEQLRQAVDGAHFPPAVGRLVLEKMVSRRNSLVRLFSTRSTAYPVNPEIAAGRELQAGKLTQEDWAGFASRFAHGDPESPFRDFHWYALAKLQAAGIDNLVARANRELMAFNPGVVRREFARDQFTRGLNHFVETGEFLTFPVSTWFSPIADLNLSVSRDVVMGNYLGTDNLVQLADSVGWDITVGGHWGVENIAMAPTTAVRATVSMSKNWTHLKPLRSLRNVFNEPYRNMFVPLLKWQLTNELERLHALKESETGAVDWNIDEDDSALSQIIGHLNDNLNVGESLLYTERLNPVGNLAVTPSLMGMPVDMKLSAGVNGVLVRRVQIYRKNAQTIQVYDDTGHGRGWSLDVSLEQYIPIVRLGWRGQTGRYSIKMHEVNINPKVSENPRLFDRAHALAQFLHTGSSELLGSIQKPATVSADYSDRSSRMGFLFWRRETLRGDSQMDVESSEGLTGRYVLYSHEVQTGMNWEAFTKDVINYAFAQAALDVSWASPVFQNPAQTIGGMGTTKQTRFETSKGEDGRFGERFMRLTDRWEGWSAKVEQVRGHMRDANTKFGTTIFDELTLENMTNLRLFDVGINLNLYEQGIVRLGQVPGDTLVLFEQRRERESGVLRRGCEPSREQRRRLSDGRVTHTCGTLNDAIRTNSQCQQYLRQNAGEDRINKCLMHLYRELYEKLTFTELASLVGSDNIFVHGSVNGFRSGDEVLNDPIPSSTVGRIGSRFWNGPLERIQQMLGIQGGEFNGYWLRERL